MNGFHSFNLTSLLYLVIFTFFFQARKGSSVDANFTICGVPRYCGELNIKFPFFIQEQREPRCGYPGFNISCRNNTNPVLTLPDGDYIIRDIFYHNQSFHLSKALQLDRYAVCNHSIQNLSLPEDRSFYLPKSQREMVLLFHCNSTLQSIIRQVSRNKINCGAENENTTTLAMLSDEPRLNLASHYCTKRVSVPVAFSDGDYWWEVEDVLNRGFVLNWIASDCTLCDVSGGKCGFDHTTYHFKCFCRDRPHSERCRRAPGKMSKLGLELGSPIVGILVLVTLIFCFIKKFSFWRMKTEENQKIEVFLKDHEFPAPKRYRYSDIKNITNSFQDKLGTGGYGDVYKGKLPDERLVAVKILKIKSQSNGAEFINEVASISRTSHVNIVTLLGFCIEGSHRALIYEFMPNGSLEKFIFQDKADRVLNWEKLYQIAIGIARGLEYLHRGCNTRILHFNIKPHNILLDEEFSPKISDFGLAKSCIGNESFVSMTGARGTIGYIAPEVFSRNFGRVSHKSDVYSYGMMIYRRVELDEELGLEGIMNEDDQEKVRQMIVVSLWCIQTDPSNRPSMSRVVEMLEGKIDSLTIPPKPFLSSSSSSPPRAPATNSSSTSNSNYILSQVGSDLPLNED